MATPRRSLIPIPPLLGGQQQPTQQPTLPTTIVQVTLPDPQDFTTKVMSAQPRDQNPNTSDVFYWPTPGGLGVGVVNTLDVPVRCRLHVNNGRNTSQPLVRPALEFDVGSGEHQNPTLDPSEGDPWAPYAWVEVTALAVPTRGGVEVSLSRKGA